jgi:hypothetical protein
MTANFVVNVIHYGYEASRLWKERGGDGALLSRGSGWLRRLLQTFGPAAGVVIDAQDF